PRRRRENDREQFPLCERAAAPRGRTWYRAPRREESVRSAARPHTALRPLQLAPTGQRAGSAAAAHHGLDGMDPDVGPEPALSGIRAPVRRPDDEWRGPTAIDLPGGMGG